MKEFTPAAVSRRPVEPKPLQSVAPEAAKDTTQPSVQPEEEKTVELPKQKYFNEQYTYEKLRSLKWYGQMTQGQQRVNESNQQTQLMYQQEREANRFMYDDRTNLEKLNMELVQKKKEI
jgi:hypothetical protein